MISNSSLHRISLKREPRLDTKLTAFAYQIEAFRAIRGLEYGAIFHEQGLGKTKIALDLALYWLETKVVDTVLFIVKKSLINNWLREFAIHTYIKPKVLTENRSSNFYVLNTPSRVLLTHYEVIKSEQKRIRLFLKSRNVGVILDESTKIKNPASELTKIFHELSGLFKKRIIMTGTPVANRPYDIWSQIWFIDHGKSLGDNFSNFKSSLGLSNELAFKQDARIDFETQLESLFKKISSFTVRENKNNDFISLPDKITRNLTVQWELHQHELYKQIQNNLRAIVVRNGIPTEDNSEDILKRMLRLVQIASNPKLVDDSYIAVPGKLPVLFDLVEGITNCGEKTIVWTSFIENADWLAHELKSFGVCKVHGKLSIEERNRQIDKFLSDADRRVFIATPGSAKEGLTLTVANHAIFYDRSFSLDDYLQAQDRIHRISQKKTCYVTNLIMEDSIDEWIDVLLYSKQLAAQLAQGDISLDYFKSQISYDFGRMIKEILKIKNRKKRD